MRILLTTGIPKLTEKSIRFNDSSLCLNNNDELARKFLYSKLDESLGAWSVELNFWIHILANKKINIGFLYLLLETFSLH